MTKQEVVKIMAVLKAAYPSYYRDMRREEAEGIVNLWTEMFEGDDYGMVAAAVKAHIASDAKGYPPHIGAIKDALYKLQQPEAMSEMEAWNLIVNALRKSGYNSKEEFEKLPPVIQGIIGSPSTLLEWCMMDTSQLQTVVQSNFMRSYKARAQYDRDYAMLPPGVKDTVAVLADKMALPQSEGGSDCVTVN